MAGVFRLVRGCLGLLLMLPGIHSQLVAGFDQREPNTTLSVPLEPPVYGFTRVDAFAGLTFNQPVAIVSPPGETNRLFIVEKGGRIQLIPDLRTPYKTLFLNISSRVNPSGEGGLLGLAFHPDYATNQLFFVYYTLTTNTAAGTGFHNRISRFQTSTNDPNVALPDSELPLITQYDQADNHNGGDLHFGPDGYLYASLGDEGGGGDTYNNSKFINKDFFCAILRIDVDKQPGNLEPNPHPASSANYAIPADNPFVGATSFNGVAINPATVRTEFWAVGLRNPWRMSFDPPTGRLYVADVGQGAREEIDVIVKGGNYGWNYREGKIAYSGTPPAGVTLLDPIWDYARSGVGTNIGNSVTGGVVYRGQRISQLYGHYVFGDYGSGNIWSLLYDGASVTRHQWLTSGSGIVAFGTDPSNGDILFAEIGTGRIRRITYSPNSTGTPLPATLAETGVFRDLQTLAVQPGIVPYSINTPFWSDHAVKTRWFSLPDTNLTFGFSPEGNWSFPAGATWIKHFELELTNGVSESRRRLETRLLIRNNGGSYGITYRWDDTQTNALLVPEEGLDESFVIHDGNTVRTQVWRYPSRTECINCHTPMGGHALGFSTAQLNKTQNYGDGPESQLAALSRVGYFSAPLTNLNTLPALVPATDTTQSVESRVRSYLAANCIQCHQPGGTGVGLWDARYATPLPLAGLIDGHLSNPGDNPANRVVVPGDPDHSMLLRRISFRGPGQMPPIGSTQLDTNAIALLTAWITQDLPAYQSFADWQISHFGSTNAPTAAPDADPDGDRAANQLEYLSRTDPKTPGDAWKISATITPANTAEIRFTQAAGRGYSVEWTESLNPPAWRPLDVPANRPLFSATDQTTVVVDPAIVPSGRFYRVRIYQP